MGEFADYALDEAIEAENDRWLYRLGRMSDQRAYDMGIIDHRGYYPLRTWNKANKVCRRCGTGGLHWKQTDRGWRLFSSETQHTCP